MSSASEQEEPETSIHSPRMLGSGATAATVSSAQKQEEPAASTDSPRVMGSGATAQAIQNTAEAPFRAVIEYFAPASRQSKITVITGSRVPQTPTDRFRFREWLTQAVRDDLAENTRGYYLCDHGRFSPNFEARMSMTLVEILPGHDMYMQWVEKEWEEVKRAKEKSDITYVMESCEVQPKQPRYRIPLQM